MYGFQNFSSANTNCSAERSFLALKRVKNYLKSIIISTILNTYYYYFINSYYYIVLLNIENNISHNISISSVINNFSDDKARKKFLLI